MFLSSVEVWVGGENDNGKVHSAINQRIVILRVRAVFDFALDLHALDSSLPLPCSRQTGSDNVVVVGVGKGYKSNPFILPMWSETFIILSMR